MSLRLVSRILCDHDGCYAWCEVLIDLADVTTVATTSNLRSVEYRVVVPPAAYADFPGGIGTGWWHDPRGLQHFCPEHRNDEDLP